MRRLLAYINDDQYEALRSIAYKNYVTLSCVIRWCIDEYAEKYHYKEKHIFDSDPELEEFLKWSDEKRKQKTGPEDE